MLENPRRRRQARNFTTNVPKVLNLKSLPNSFRKLTLGAPDKVMNLHDDSHRYYLPVIMPVNRQLIHPNKDEFRFCSVCLSLFSVFFSVFPFQVGAIDLIKCIRYFETSFIQFWTPSCASELIQMQGTNTSGRNEFLYKTTGNLMKPRYSLLRREPLEMS